MDGLWLFLGTVGAVWKVMTGEVWRIDAAWVMLSGCLSGMRCHCCWDGRYVRTPNSCISMGSRERITMVYLGR
jgi:hypothetical protein